MSRVICLWLLRLNLVLMLVAEEIEPCTRRVYLARAEQADENGLKCWDMVKIPSCGGFCESKEIPDWQFPFRRAHHPVCSYGGRATLMVRLRHCDPGVTAGTELFHYVSATDCRCKICSSQRTSCELLHPNSTILHSLTQSEIDNDLPHLQSNLMEILFGIIILNT